MTMCDVSNPARDCERVSRVIDDLPDEEKSALWLLACSRLDPRGQERIAEDAWVGAVGGL